MTQPDDGPQLSIFLELLGRTLDGTTGLIDYTVESSFITPSDAFSFTLYDADPKKLSGLELQPVSLEIAGNPQLLGRIEVTEIGDGDGSAIRCMGRDYIAELLDCDLDPTVVLKKGMTLADAIKLAAGPVGISTVLGDDEVKLADLRSGAPVGGRNKSKLKGFLEGKLEDYKGEPGENIGEFIFRLCNRFGCLTQPGRKRSEIVLAEPNYTAPTLYELVRLRDAPGSSGNTIMSSRCRRDYQTPPTYVLFSGKQGASGEGRSDTNFEVGLQIAHDVLEPHINDKFVVNRRLLPSKGPKTESGLYRLFYQRDQGARNQQQLAKAGLRATADRLRPMLEYQCTVKGHAAPDRTALHAVDTMIKVRDEICGVDETLWVENVAFRYDQQSGATTTLGCVRPGTYVL